MNSPYMGRFYVSQQYKPGVHDGLDLVGLDSKEIHATANGKVVFAGWENPSNHSQGFGQYVVVLADGKYYHYGHLSNIKVSVGQLVKCTDVIGVEGYTGHTIPAGPSGSHCHYCIRTSMSPGTALDVCGISGIPNIKGGTYDDGYRSTNQPTNDGKSDAKALQLALKAHGYDCGSADGIIGPKTTAAMVNALSDMWL